MCLAAIYWARLDRIFFANSREDAAAIGFDDALIYGEVSKPIERPRHPDRSQAGSCRRPQAVSPNGKRSPTRSPTEAT